MVIPEGTTHTCCTSKVQKPDIIDYFLAIVCALASVKRISSDLVHATISGGMMLAADESLRNPTMMQRTAPCVFPDVSTGVVQETLVRHTPMPF